MDDVDAFAEKINHLSESSQLHKEMGEYNRAKVERLFTLERMIREYVKLFEKVRGKMYDAVILEYLDV